MFDKHISVNGPRFPSHISINSTEKRAPTDESVRLLREMEEAAEKNVVARGTLENNLLEGQWTILSRPYEDKHECVLRMKINGHEIVEKWVLPCPYFQNPREICRGIFTKACEVVTLQLIKQFPVDDFDFRNYLKGKR